MDGNLNHDYLQEDIGYDDLINNAAWSGAGNHQYSFQQQPHPADPYSQFHNTSQAPASYDHYDLAQQPSFSQLSYSNSPYDSQFQHSGHSDILGATSFGLDPSLQNASSYHDPHSSFSFNVPQSQSAATISPQTLQYNMASHQNLNRGLSNSPFQPATNNISNNFSQAFQPSSSIYYNDMPTGMGQQNLSSSIQYPTLVNGEEERRPSPGLKKPPEESSSAPQLPAKQDLPPPNSLRVTHPEMLAAKDTSSRPRFQYAPFIAWQDTPIQIAPILKNSLPKYHPRKSRSGRDLVPGFDVSRTLTPARITAKKGKLRKESKSALSSYKGTSGGPKPLIEKVNSLREDGSSNKPPSTPTETSSSEEDSSSSEEESEYEDDEMLPLQDISEVRGPVRPTNLAEAARWDVIGIIWKDKNASPTSEAVKESIEKYANFVIAQRIKLKSNATKVEEAAQHPGDLAKLKNERKDLLEVFYQTIETGNVHGFESIIENLGGHQRLVNGLTTTLIECIKADDFVGKLPKAVFTLLAKFQTMTDELLKKLKFDSIQKRWNKKGDDETKKCINTILANTTDAKERAAKLKKADDDKKGREELVKTQAARATALKPAKRVHDDEGATGKPNKKFASDVAGTPGTSTRILPPKRPSGNLLGISSVKPTPKPVAKKREPSPPHESKLGAILASIAEPPKVQKAPEAPPRAPETAEEKTRRERKESRRHLRVKFKEGSELEQIREFTHTQDEDEGRQDDMLRDAHDNHNEGMMHKKRVSENMDESLEEEEYQPPDVERPYTEPKGIDFSQMQKSTRFGRTSTTRGGDLPVSTPEQKTQERREGLELMVIYTDPDDIPPSAKEPPQSDGPGDMQQERFIKQPSEAWLVHRLREINNHGTDHAYRLFLQHQQEQLIRDAHEKRNHSIAHLSTSTPSTNVSSLLQQLESSAKPFSSQPEDLTNLSIGHSSTAVMNANQNAQLENLQLIVNSLRGLRFPPTEPPVWMTNEKDKAGWWEGYNRDEARREVAQKLTTRLQPSASTTTQYSQPVPLPQIPPYVSLTRNQEPSSQLPSAPMHGMATGYNGENPTNAQSFDLNAWYATANQPQNHSSIALNQHSNWDGDKWEEETPTQKSNRSLDKSNSKKKRANTWTDGPLDENGEYKGKKRPCRFYHDGKCAKGTKCTFLHEAE